MPDIFGQPTASEQIAIVKANRILSEDVRKQTGVPHDEIAGKIIMFSHVVTPAEDAANSIAIDLPDMNVVESYIVQITDAAGVVKAITPTLVMDGLLFKINGSGFVATDIANILIKGRKV